MTATPPCATERGWRACLGARVFRWRSWLPVPLVLLLFVVPTDVDPDTVFLGGLIALAGMTLRAAGVAVAGTVTRRRSRAVERLVREGIFAWVRNPLYVGNVLLWCGVLVATEAWTLAPWALATCALIYTCIVWYEEGVLESHFGAEYLSYKATVPRWIPRQPTARQAPVQHDWTSAWRKEWHSAAAFTAIALALRLKEALLG
jgi:protein-S-isoprenylcysteine O-methyltransferase Ste14